MLVRTTSWVEIPEAYENKMGITVVPHGAREVKRHVKAYMPITGFQITRYWKPECVSYRADYSDNGSSDGMRGNFHVHYERSVRIEYTLENGETYSEIKVVPCKENGELL